jgi:hypothetical protein
MQADIDTGDKTPQNLWDMLGKELADRYGVSRTTALKALHEVLAKVGFVNDK